MMGSPHLLTIADAASLVQQRELSSRELTSDTLERIQDVQPRYHPFALVTAERALEDASRADEELAAGRWRGPLHGIPVSLKDTIDTQGIPTRSGSAVREAYVPEADSAVAERLRNAGAVLLGKTVTQELTFGVVSDPARCAWDVGRIPGGSSGGSAVGIALDASAGSVGGDTGGSIRIPASLNGVVGLKPTSGLVSRFGVLPLSWSLDVLGPMGKTSLDAALILEVIAGFDPRDPSSSKSGGTLDYASGIVEGLGGVRCGVPSDYFFDDLPDDIAETFWQAVSTLKAGGAVIREVSVPLVEHSAAVNMVCWIPEASEYHGDDIRRHPDRFSPDVRVLVQVGTLLLAADYIQALRVRSLIRDALRSTFIKNDLDVILTPTLSETALRADEVEDLPEEEGTTFAGYTRNPTPFNASGQPALTVPCGFDIHGIPCGLQIVGRPFAESAVLRVGHAFEEMTDWHLRRPEVQLA